jgi:hypothetical protein
METLYKKETIKKKNKIKKKKRNKASYIKSEARFELIALKNSSIVHIMMFTFS